MPRVGTKCDLCPAVIDSHGAKGLCHKCYTRRHYHDRKGRIGQWSQKHSECKLCGTTARPHAGHGFCYKCKSAKDYDVDVHRTYQYRQKLKADFGLTLKDYNRMFEAQGGACAICYKPESKLLRSKANLQYVQRLSVDHDHQTTKVRGLLCSKCNRALGYFNDDPELLIRAAAYVRLHRSNEVAAVIEGVPSKELH